MEEYSFLAHTNEYLAEILKAEGLELDLAESKLSIGYKDTLIIWKSKKYKLRSSLEHYRVYVEIAPLVSKDPNHWFDFDLVVAYVLHDDAKKWEYNLPRGLPVSQVIDQQLQRWQKILDGYLKTTGPLFYEDKFWEMVDELRKFRVNYNKAT